MKYGSAKRILTANLEKYNAITAIGNINDVKPESVKQDIENIANRLDRKITLVQDISYGDAANPQFFIMYKMD
jgi:hypothetical protein